MIEPDRARRTTISFDSPNIPRFAEPLRLSPSRISLLACFAVEFAARVSDRLIDALMWLSESCARPSIAPSRSIRMSRSITRLQTRRRGAGGRAGGGERGGGGEEGGESRGPAANRGDRGLRAPRSA